jgi:integrase
VTSKKDNPVSGISVYQQKGRKTWSYRLELDRHPLTDERQFEYGHGFPADEDALTAAIKAKAAHKAGNRVKPTKLTVGGFFDEWMTSIKDSVKPSTFTNYSDYQDAYLKPTIWKKPLQKVDVPTLNTLYRHLLANGRCKPDNNTRMYEYWEAQRKAGRNLTPNELAAEVEGITIHAARKAVARYRSGRIPVPKTPGLAPKTVKNVHRMIHLALASAVAWRCIDYNPAEHAALPRESRKGTRKRGTTWTPDELAAWLAVAVTDRDAGIWVLAATTGMRRSELAGAERELLDLDNATLEIADTRVVVDGKADESDGKTESGRRVISLDPLTVAYLRRHLAMLDTEKEAFGDSYHDSGLLVCHPDGRPVHPDTITDRFNKLVDRAGVKRIRLHDVRHTYATTSLDAGVDPKIVADRIGHANMAYTLAIYTHKSTGKDRGAAETVAGVLLGPGWTCAKCKAVYIGTAPENGLCETCSGDDGAAGVPVPA